MLTTVPPVLSSGKNSFRDKNLSPLFFSNQYYNVVEIDMYPSSLGNLYISKWDSIASQKIKMFNLTLLCQLKFYKY